MLRYALINHLISLINVYVCFCNLPYYSVMIFLISHSYLTISVEEAKKWIEASPSSFMMICEIFVFFCFTLLYFMFS